jgi:hypothetical protein
MEDIYEQWIRGRKSIVALTDNSKVFQTKFAEFVKQDTEGIGAMVSNMGWAKHRHESMFKPISRSVLNICAQLSLAAWIASARRGHTEAKRAASWLDWISEEKYIQACMMADAGHETMVLLRYTDDEDMATEKAAEHIATLRKHVFYLFGPARGCINVQGHTQIGLEIMQKPRFVTLNGKLASLGGPGKVTDELVNKCLKRMAAWLVVVDAVITTEFPSIDVVVAFSAFDLEALAGDDVSATTQEHIRRLALVFRVPAAALLAEFSYLRPIARNIFKDKSCSNTSAWNRALTRVLEGGNKSKALESLTKVIVEWCTFVATTAAVEQGFSKTRWALKSQQGSAFETFENMVCKLLLDRRPEEDHSAGHSEASTRDVGSWSLKLHQRRSEQVNRPRLMSFWVLQ